MDRERGNELIEIHDPEISTAEIMAQIRERIERRRKESGPTRQVFPSFGGTVYPGEPVDLEYDPDLYHHLRLANEIYANAETEAQLPATPATRLPVLGVLWQRVRAYLHRITLFYVNRTLAHQVSVDRHVISVLNQMTALSQAQQRRISALEADIKDLQSRKEL